MSVEYFFNNFEINFLGGRFEMFLINLYKKLTNRSFPFQKFKPRSDWGCNPPYMMPFKDHFQKISISIFNFGNLINIFLFFFAQNGRKHFKFSFKKDFVKFQSKLNELLKGFVWCEIRSTSRYLGVTLFFKNRHFLLKSWKG